MWFSNLLDLITFIETPGPALTSHELQHGPQDVSDLKVLACKNKTKKKPAMMTLLVALFFTEAWQR